jgi:glyoxylase-like metal-dependent hydrolase (beta-lactamase superfamily II)
MQDIFPNAKAYFGPGTTEFCAPGHFADPENVQWDGRFFHPLRKTQVAEDLKGPWSPLGPFEKALDFFGTGSFWIIQAPGHMEGNLCAAVRKGNDEWIILGSDCCHSRETMLFTSLPLF